MNCRDADDCMYQVFLIELDRIEVFYDVRPTVPRRPSRTTGCTSSTTSPSLYHPSRLALPSSRASYHPPYLVRTTHRTSFTHRTEPSPQDRSLNLDSRPYLQPNEVLERFRAPDCRDGRTRRGHPVRAQLHYLLSVVRMNNYQSMARSTCESATEGEGR